MNRLRLRKAFTVVEMVIVIAVIAILSAVLIPTISGVIQKANVSADQQFAASLNIQLALWEVDNGEIDNESDLRDAINAYYGTDEAPDYYSTLAPKSGKNGYHFWYDVENKQVVVSTYEGFLPKDEGAPALLAAGEPTFSPASPRSLMISTEGSKKNFFLMDRAGSALANHLAALDTVSAEGLYNNLIGYIDEIDDRDATLADIVLGKLSGTAILNANGMFVGGSSVQYVYIPTNAGKLGQEYYGPNDANFLAVSEIEIPSGVVVGSNSLDMFTHDVILNINAASDEEVKGMFGANAFGSENYGYGNNKCRIERPNGDKYIVEQTEVKKLGADGAYTSVGNVGFSNPVVSFEIDCSIDNTTMGEGLAYIDATNTGTTLYVAYNAGSFNLSAENFVGKESGDVSSKQVNWSVAPNDLIEVTSTGAVTIKKAPKVDETYAVTVTATAVAAAENAGVETFDIYIVIPTDFDVKLDGNASTEINYDGTTNAHTLTVGSISCNYSGMVKIDSLQPSFASEENTCFTIDTNGNITLKDPVVAGNQKVTVTYGPVIKEITISVKDNASMPIEVADNANTEEKYGLTFHVGNMSTIDLGTLFSLVNEDEPVNGTVEVLVYDGDKWGDETEELLPESGNFVCKVTPNNSDWTKTTLKFTGTGSAEIVVKVGSKESEPLYVNVVNAYNVANVDQWKAVPNKTDIVLLGTVDLNGQSDIEVSLKDKATMGNNNNYSGTGWYSKNLGDKTIFGNYNMIKIPDGFKIKSEVGTGSNNYFLYMTGGTLNHLILDGPGYTESSNVYNSTVLDMVAAKGYYVAGVEMSGGTINNCYISGFRSPVRVDGGTVNMNGTTLVGGAFANIYVAKIGNTSTITLDNVTTIQWGDLKGIVGAGIFFDASTGNVTLNLKNDTVQYNWAYSGGSYKGYAAQIVNQFFKTKSEGCDGPEEYVYPQMIHEIRNTDYASTGIIFESSVDKVTVDTSNLNNSIPKYITDSNERMTYSKWVVYNYKDCNAAAACTHDLFPDENGDGKYTIDDFLKSMEKAN